MSTEVTGPSQLSLEDDSPETNELEIQTQLNLADDATESIPGVGSLLHDFL
jgi:hypothetical protein